MRLAPDLAEKVWAVRDVRDLPTRREDRDRRRPRPRERRLRGLDAEDRVNRYGVELDALVAAIGLEK